MKTGNITLLISCIIICLMTAGCSDDEIWCKDCLPLGFKYTYLENLQDKDVFFIKGEALHVNKHGRKIRIIKDLKGNYAGEPFLFVWGESETSFCGRLEQVDTRPDDITMYNNGDTLILFIKKACKRFYNDIEQSGDYATLGNCTPSVIKFSSGYAIGRINNWLIPVLWEELQEELDMLLNMEEKPSWWTEYYVPDPFIINCKGLLSYDYHYFVQGVVLDSDKNDGKQKQVQMITDFKGNFPEQTEPFTVNMDLYNAGDTLLMLLEDHAQGTTGNFSVLGFPIFSVLKLSNNSVSGYITSCCKGEEVMSWRKLQTLLNLNKETKP